MRPQKRRFAPFESPSWSLLERPESAFNRKTREFFSETVDTAHLAKQGSPKADLKRQHRKVFELSSTVAFTLLIVAGQVARHFTLAADSFAKVDIKIEVADIPPTEQFRKPPPPVRPSIPIPTEEESIPDDLTIASTELDLTDIPAPPSLTEDEDELAIFVVYDKPPLIIGGIAALNKYLKYPIVAERAGLEGTVFVKVLVSIDGRTERMEILKAKPAHMGFEESAMEAIKKIRWKPARQRDKKIRVWVSIPVQFKLVS